MDELPIACTLSPGELHERRALIGSLTGDALIAREPIAGGVRARFRAAPGVERRVRELAAAEARCCPFLELAVTTAPDTVLLDVTGAPAAQPVIAELLS
jgi:MerR family transcriptional regulator, copper efflux regulator